MNRRKNGTVLIITLGILTIMAVMGTSFAILMRVELEATENYKLAERAKLIASDGIIYAGKSLQDLLTYSYYSSLYNDDPNIPEYLKTWCFGVDTSTGDYKKDDITGEYSYFGGDSILSNLAPVSLPYPYVDKVQKKAYIDFNGDGEYKLEDNDVLLEEYDMEAENRIFYDEAEERTLFSGFPADGRFLGNVDIVAGQSFTGGNRFKLKIIETNSQLSVNYLSSTLYDFIVDADEIKKNCEGSQFRYMLFFLGQGIQKSLATRIRAETKEDARNPFNEKVVEELWKLKMSYGSSTEVQQFSSKTQVRAIVENTEYGNPGYWKYVRDFITIAAWPGYNTVYAQFNPNTVVPNITTADKYKEKLGEYDENDPVEGSTTGKMTEVNVVTRVQPPIDANTATLPVLYSAIANVSGDARFWYFSPDKGNLNESLYASEPLEDPYILSSELARANKMWAANEKSIATKGVPGKIDSKNFYFKKWDLISDVEREVRQFDNFTFSFENPSTTVLFKRNYQALQFLNISPFRTVWTAEEMGGGSDYAYNFSKCIESLRPFTSWADFDQRVIQEIIIDKMGRYLIPGGGEVKICEPYDYFWHPWNKNGPGGDPDCDISELYHEQWYYEAVADLTRANFNPTPKLTKWNPDATYYQKVDRSDLVYWTVPFIFHSPGIYELTSIGEIIGQVFDAEEQDYIPMPVVQKQFQAIIKVADIVRHHSQSDFCTGFPTHEGAFEDDIEDYSVVRLYAHENSDPAFRRYSRITTYPQPINEDVLKSHIENHERPNRGSSPPDSGLNKWERTYYTGNYSQSGHSAGTELLYGNNVPSSQIPVGYVTVRPQDTSPFDYEMRVDPENDDYMGTPNGLLTCNFSTVSVGKSALEISTANDNDKDDGHWLNFWMPFNETYNTISKNSGASVYGNMPSGGNSFQSARIGSEDNNGRRSANSIDSIGLIWNASGYTFRTFDYARQTTDIVFPNYLEYPAGVGFKMSNNEHDLNQKTSSVDSEGIIEIMPHEDIQGTISGGEYEDSDEYKTSINETENGMHRQTQWQRQKQTNFPYYKGTVEFWFKSDIDQWDMTAEGYDADEDTFYGGFISANVLVQADEEDGIQGCQTYILREMGNAFRVTRVYFIDAIKGTPGGTASMNHWVVDDHEGGAGSGEGHAISTYIYKKGDTVPDVSGLNNTDSDDGDLDPEDLGFIYARFDSWYELSERENEFKWRPHEWYHLAFSFRSDAAVANNPAMAINFFINGVYVDPGMMNYPSSRMSTTMTDWNSGAKMLGTEFKDISKEKEPYVQKLGTIINEVIPESDHGARLVVGAIKRNQATKEQIEYWTDEAAASGWADEVLTKEMFYFADGPFVASCNGTMDSLRITGKYLNNADSDFGSGTRIRAFARYNTSPGEASPDKLGSYQNGFPNSWGRDVRIANISWNEYRPKWDSAISEEIMFEDSAYCELSFWSFDERKFDRIDCSRSYGFDSAKSAMNLPFYAKLGNSPSGNTIGVVDMGVSFPGSTIQVIGEDLEKFMLPKGGCFVYEVAFYQGDLFAANSAPIFDELTVTVLTPLEIFSFEEVSE
ncbi:MAG: hypothetical protein K8S87_00315 [Planctomycetes bacterium]|nr:hypothetical protein [Planctomycetota bacterium]